MQTKARCPASFCIQTAHLPQPETTQLVPASERAAALSCPLGFSKWEQTGAKRRSCCEQAPASSYIRQQDKPKVFINKRGSTLLFFASFPQKQS